MKLKVELSAIANTTCILLCKPQILPVAEQTGLPKKIFPLILIKENFPPKLIARQHNFLVILISIYLNTFFDFL
jgi:hypothetical protein